MRRRRHPESFVNDVNGMNIPNKLYYYPTGTGNDLRGMSGKTVFGSNGLPQPIF